jgi:hypothetical protein
VAGGCDRRGERSGLVVEEAPERVKVLLDLGAPGSSPRVLEQAEAEMLECPPRAATQKAGPLPCAVRREPTEREDVGVARHGHTVVTADRRRVSNEAQETHEREERPAGNLARAKGTVKVERRKRLGRGSQAEAGLVAVDVNAYERIEEGEAPGCGGSR